MRSMNPTDNSGKFEVDDIPLREGIRFESLDGEANELEQMRAMGDELPDGVDAKRALKLALKVSSGAIKGRIEALERGDKYALMGFGKDYTIDDLRYVVENRTLVDAAAYRAGQDRGINEVAIELGLPFRDTAQHGTYTIDDIKEHLSLAGYTAEPHDIHADISRYIEQAKATQQATSAPRIAR